MPPVPRFCFRVPCSHVPAQHFFCVPRAPAFLFCVPLLPLQLTHKVLSGAQLLVKMRYMRGGGEASPVASWLVPNAALWGSYHIYTTHHKKPSPTSSQLQTHYSNIATPNLPLHTHYDQIPAPGQGGGGEVTTLPPSGQLACCVGGGRKGVSPSKPHNTLYIIFIN